MSTKTKLFSASLILAASLMTAGIAQAREAQSGDNRCWGKAASSLAQGDQMGQEVPWATIRGPGRLLTTSVDFEIAKMFSQTPLRGLPDSHAWASKVPQ